MPTFPKPADYNGTQMVEELRAAGFNVEDTDLLVTADEELSVNVDADKAAVQAVIAAHVAEPDPVPVEPLTDAEITALRALLATK